MEPLPKIVRQRLQASQKDGAHPDAGLLTAFAEGSLIEPERASLQEHLATCEDCRQVISLAQPPAELQEAVAAAAAPSPIRRAWFLGSGLRWAALAACVIVAGAVLVRYRASEQKEALVALQKPAPPPAPSTEPAERKDREQQADATGHAAMGGAQKEQPERKENVSAALQPSAPAPQKQLVASRAAPRLDVEKKAAAGLPMSNSSGDAIQIAPRDEVAGAAARPIFSAKVANPENPAGGSRQQNLKRESDQVSAEQNIVVADTAAPSAAENKPAEVSIAQAAPAPARATARGGVAETSSGAMGVASSVRGQTLRLAAINTVTPQWTLSSDGTTLLRSLDAGRSWQTIPVADGVVLRALAASGSQIWVGGLHGALFHSLNSGQNWVQVRATAAGRALAADIVRIEFPDPLHGSVTTAQGNVWSTSDGGQTWQVK